MSKLREFARVNGWFHLAEEIGSRTAGSMRSWLLARQLKTEGLYLGRYARLKGLAFMQVGKDFQVGDSLWMEAITRYEDQVFQPRIVIGNSVRASNWVHIAATHYVEIGDHCLIGSKVIITDHGHGQYANGHSSPLEPPAKRRLDSNRKVIIGRNVWLGESVVVMPDVTIGEGAVIGANSIVSRDIPPFTVAVGAPARPIKQYDFQEGVWKKV
jgi:acetyltransferase-like isoleucine patch superfamily enzyme